MDDCLLRLAGVLRHRLEVEAPFDRSLDLDFHQIPPVDFH